MISAASRMRKLIDDLLTFSRVTTQAKPFAPVRLDTIAREVTSILEVRIEQVKGRVEIGSLPEIDADAFQLRQLLQNLVANALKFHKPEVPPVVRIEGREEGDWCEISVKDNGIGFDEKYLDRIFTIFQRLHGRSAYEGTGVGLAICRRIVERHGGTITAKSAPDHGAEFLIRLPLRQRDPDVSREILRP